MPERSGSPAPHLLHRISQFWHDLARPAEYPVSEQDWFDLVGHPVAITGAIHWGVALGTAGRGSRLQLLIDAYTSAGDPRSAAVLRAILERGVRHAGGRDGWDALVAPPPRFVSGPPHGITELLPPADEAIPPGLPRDIWMCRGARLALPDDGSAALTARHVSDLRILLIALRLQSAAEAEPWSGALYRAGAGRVGLLVVGLDSSVAKHCRPAVPLVT